MSLEDYGYFTDEEWNETPKQRSARIRAELLKRQEKARAAKVPKGTCYKCGKHIGRGIAFHVKACNG